MSFNALSDKAIAASKNSKLPKSFWSWEDMLNTNKLNYFPYTPATNMLWASPLRSICCTRRDSTTCSPRHERFAEATRRAVRAWGLEILCRDAKYYSPTVTAVLLPEGHDADKLRSLALDHFDISYGMSFGKLAGKYFRVGHLGEHQRSHHSGRARRNRNGAYAGGCPDPEGRRAGRHGLHRVGSCGPAACRSGVTVTGRSNLPSPACGGGLGRGLAGESMPVGQAPSLTLPASGGGIAGSLLTEIFSHLGDKRMA